VTDDDYDDDDDDDDDDQRSFGSQRFETTTPWRFGCVTKQNCYVSSNAKNEHFPSLHPVLTT
jgi:hypothetical protein